MENKNIICSRHEELFEIPTIFIETEKKYTN